MPARIGGLDDFVWSGTTDDPEELLRSRSKRRPLVVLASLVIVAGLVLTVLPAVLPSGALVLPPLERYGPPGPQFSLSFPGTVHEKTYVHSEPVHLAQYGTTLGPRFVWDDGFAKPVQVSVFVDELTNAPPPSRRNPFLRSYLQTTHGGRIGRAFGLPAAVETTACTPGTGAQGTGTCKGTTISNLVVLDDLTLYDVNAVGPRATVRAVIATFRP